MNPQKPQTPSKNAPRSAVAALRERPPSDMKSAVMLSLIVCPQGGVGHRRHGQGRSRPAS
jgi:hypothetical protein